MSGRVEKLLKAYPEMVQQRDCLAYQLAHFQGVSVGEVIDSMMTPQVGGERVQSGGLSNRTERIALEYRERQERINRAWYAHLEQQWGLLNDEIVFLESAIETLPNKLAPFMRDLVIHHLTWDALENKYHISRYTVSAYRKKAIQELEARYNERERDMIAYMLD